MCKLNGVQTQWLHNIIFSALQSGAAIAVLGIFTKFSSSTLSAGHIQMDSVSRCHKPTDPLCLASKTSSKRSSGKNCNDPAMTLTFYLSLQYPWQDWETESVHSILG